MTEPVPIRFPIDDLEFPIHEDRLVVVGDPARVGDPVSAVGEPARAVAPVSTVGATSPAGAVPRQPHRLGWPKRLSASLIVTDLVVVLASVGIAFLLRFGLDGSPLERTASTVGFTLVGVGIVVCWMIALSATRSRDLRIVGIGVAEYQRVANATILTFGLIAVAAYLTQIDIARGYLLVALPLGLVLLLVGRAVWRRILASMRRAGRCLTGAIVVGPREDVEDVVAQLGSNLRAGYRPIAVVITGQDDPTGDEVDDLPRIPMGRLVEVSKETRTRAVMIAGELPGGRKSIRDLSWSLENSKAELILVSRLTDVSGPRIHLRPVQGLPLVHVDLPQYSGFNHTVKRTFDVVATTVLLIVLAPVFALVAMAVRLGSPGPVLYRQERVGMNGRRFTMVKFRSMVVDADDRRAELAERDEGNGVLFKVRDDPRLTPVGRVLRKHSIDELPQLWNVLVGDMSLVGPRPPLAVEVERYRDGATRRLLTKPGLTGPWQVGGRSHLSWEESVKLDLYYVENWSITGDLLILLRTVREVLRGDGAY